jgi:hypothetical protein
MLCQSSPRRWKKNDATFITIFCLETCYFHCDNYAKNNITKLISKIQKNWHKKKERVQTSSAINI